MHFTYRAPRVRLHQRPRRSSLSSRVLRLKDVTTQHHVHTHGVVTISMINTLQSRLPLLLLLHDDTVHSSLAGGLLGLRGHGGIASTGAIQWVGWGGVGDTSWPGVVWLACPHGGDRATGMSFIHMLMSWHRSSVSGPVWDF